MLLTLFDSNRQIKATFEPSESSTQDKEIQGDNLLKLSFTLHECISIDVNDYLDYEGERYWATEKYVPSQKSTMEWEYSFQMKGIESLITRFLVLNNTDGENEAVFSLTARPIDHMRLIVKNINEGMDGLTNFKVGIVEGTENITIEYTGKYCNDGLKELADAVHTEWWFDGQTVNLCRCEHGEELTLGYDKGLVSLDRDMADGAKFYTRLFPIGSSRNIDSTKYGHSRLMLPNGEKYVDVNVEKYGIIHHYEQTAFANIYPRRVGVVSSVRQKEVKDNDGKPFTIYYFKDSELNFDPNKYEIANLVKRVSFQEGSELAGLGTDTDHYFEVNYNSETKEFEIITIWPYNDGTQLPGGVLVPKIGDKYILWNLRMPDEYYSLAEQELREAVEKYNQKNALDVSRYKAPTDHVWIEDNHVDLFVGRRVRLESSEYFPKTGYRKSRITRISRELNLPGKMDIEISDALSTSVMTKVSESITEVKNYTGALVGALNVPDLIQSGDTTKPADTNIYSARRTHKEFLSKTAEDVATKLITFLEGIGLGVNGQFSINADGVALLSRILIGNFVKGASGAGIYADEQGNYHIEGDYLHVRKQLKAEEVEIMKSSHINGKIINSPGSFTISKVEKIEGGWRCYFTQQDGDGRMVSNTMGMDDYAYCETFNLVNQQGKMSNHYWHRRVFRLGTDYVDICGNTNADDYASGSDEPKVGDEVSTLGNKTNPARQHAIIQAAAGTGSPYYRMYVGINSFSLPKPKIQMSPTEGSWWMVTDEHGNDMPMEEYISSLKSQLNAVQDQADKQIVIWFGDAVPTASTEPASEWTDESTKEMHLHDIYYNRSYAETGGGRAYSFEKNPDNTYAWKEITDADVLKSLEAAQRAQDTADGKRRMFVREQPIPPYDKGDQWSNATHEGKYQNDLLVCVKSRGKDDEFDIDDWVSAQQYTTKQFESSLNVADKRIDAFISDLSSGLERVGFHLDGENSTFDVVADRFRALTTTGAVSFFTSEGKLNTTLFDAKQIVTDGLRAGNIDAEKAKIMNLIVDGESEFRGKLKGTWGSFTSLTCVDDAGTKELGGIYFDVFNGKSAIGLKGDFYMQGYIEGDTRKRFPNFYATNLYCNNQFAHNARVCAVVKDDGMFVYNDGHVNSNGIRIGLTFNHTIINGRHINYYRIPMYSPGTGGENGAIIDIDNPKLQKYTQGYYDERPIGVPIDVIIFNGTKNFCYEFFGMGYGKQWTVINGNDSQAVYIFDHRELRKFEGGYVFEYMYVNPHWLTPEKSNDNLGAGVFYTAGIDFDW